MQVWVKWNEVSFSLVKFWFVCFSMPCWGGGYVRVESLQGCLKGYFGNTHVFNFKTFTKVQKILLTNVGV